MNEETLPSETLVTEKPRRTGVWAKLGGGSLTIAVLIHLILLGLATLWVIRIVKHEEKDVPFLPGGQVGGGGGGSLGMKNPKPKAQPAQGSIKRVFAEGAASNFALPDPGDSFGEISALQALSGGGGLSDGLGGSGSGGGFGNGNGRGNGNGFGNGNGNGFGGTGAAGIKLFGVDLQVKSIGVVFDVSRSMTPHLEKVLKEIERVAEGSPVVLHVGCGIGTPSRDRPRDRILEVNAPRDGFKKFWYLNQADENRNLTAAADPDKIDTSGPIPRPTVYEMLAHRPKTYFHERGTTPLTSEALLCRELRNVEAIYWFADFQDAVSSEEAERVVKELKQRRQKLFIHPLLEGTYFKQVLDTMATPTGGKQITPPKI